MRSVALEKATAFIGQDALRRLCEETPRKSLALFRLDDGDAFPWGGEGILRADAPVGEITSAGWSHKLGRAVAMGYVRNAEGVTREWLLGGSYEIDIAGEHVAASVLPSPAFPYRD
jgi:4-methylaminobutanoate oxidase (formaldehyde-forming)